MEIRRSYDRLISPWEKNCDRELTVTTVVTAPGPNDHGSVTARLGQLSHGEVTAQSWLGHSSVTARSQLNHGPGHGSVTAGCDHFGHCELTVNSPHSVESPSTVDPQWDIWYWGSKWNLHTVCWSAGWLWVGHNLCLLGDYLCLLYPQ